MVEKDEVNYVNIFKAEKILEKNWAIDLSARITEYLRHLDSIDGGVGKKKRSRKRTHDEVGQNEDDVEEIQEDEEESDEDSEEEGSESEEHPPLDLDGPRCRINFAEAAAVIQGAAEIYGKKVDYVYQRTMKYQTLIAAGQEGTVEKRVGKKERTDEFRRKIKTLADRACEILDFNLLETTKRKAFRQHVQPTEAEWNSRLESSKRKTALLTKLLMEFVPLRPDEKRELAVHCGTKNREIFGNADDFKVNRFAPHSRGALVLRIQNEDFMDLFRFHEPEVDDEDTQERSLSLADQENIPEIAQDRTNNIADAFDNIPDAYDLDCQSVVGAGMNNFPEPGQMSPNLQSIAGQESEPTAASCTDRTVRSSELAYTYHEPTETLKFRSREQKIGKTYIPADKERDRRDALIKKISEEEGIKDVPWSLTNFLQELSRDSRALEKKSLRFADRAPYLSDPVAVIMQKCISKETKKRQARKKLVDELHERWLLEHGEIHEAHKTIIPDVEDGDQSMVLPEEPAARRIANRESDAITQPPPTPSQIENNRCSNYDGPDMFHINYDIPDDDFAIPDQDIQIAADEEIAMDYSHVFNEPPEVDMPSYNLLGDLRGSPTQNNNTAYAGKLFDDNDAEDDVMADFDFLGDPNDPFLVLPKPIEELSGHELVRFRVHEFWQIPKDHMTKLMVRVQDWEEKMVPFLDEELERREFKIHDYGTEILEKFSAVGEEKSFADLVAGVERHEVSRYFLSALMLTNTYNVKTNDESERLGLERAVNTMKMEFLKKERHHECFEAGGEFLQN